MSQRQLAAASGLTPTYLGDRLRNEVALDIDDIDAIATALELDPLELMERAKEVVRKAKATPTARATPDQPRGPLVTPTGGYIGPQSGADDEMLRRAHHRQPSGER
ncbi:helix-turn-helix domain-containing protein [Nocardia sp. R16R-3T]